MTAIQTQSQPLYLRGQGEYPVQTVGNIRVTDLTEGWSGDGGLRLSLEYEPLSEQVLDMRLLSLQAHIEDSRSTPRVYGRMVVAVGSEVPALGPNASRKWWWIWHLPPEEIERIEHVRQATGARPTFRLVLSGYAQITYATWAIGSELPFSLSTDEWLGLIRSLGYESPPSVTGLVGATLASDPSWQDAEEAMRRARALLNRGEDHEAVASAYRAFDQVLANPYKAAWTKRLISATVPPDKAKHLEVLLQKHTNVLSNLGRHPGGETDEDGNREMLPLDHWEAELLVATSQLLLAAVYRWRSKQAASDPEQ